MSLEQFMATHFDPPEPDFVAGEIVQRSTPGWTHGRLQGELWGCLKRALSLVPATEVRVRLASDRAYVIDVCAYPAGEDMPRFPATAPVVAAEILSADDRAKDVYSKLADYHDWGVPHVWLIDPWSRHLNVYDRRGLLHVEALPFPNSAYESLATTWEYSGGEAERGGMCLDRQFDGFRIASSERHDQGNAGIAGGFEHQAVALLESAGRQR